MSDFIPSPELIALRQKIDALDQELALMLCARLKLIHQAAPLKPSKAHVRLEDRIEEIIQKVLPIAEREHIPQAYLENVYRYLIEQSIESEAREWDKLN